MEETSAHLSQKGVRGRPSCLSLSPCLKNSSQQRRDQRRETGHGRHGLEMSAHWGDTGASTSSGSRDHLDCNLEDKVSPVTDGHVQVPGV